MSKANKRKDSSDVNSEQEMENLEKKTAEADKKASDSPKLNETIEADLPESEEDKATDWEDRYLRVAAEYDNYRRRTKSELEYLFQDVTCAVVYELLPVLDSFESALNMEDEAGSDLKESDSTGISLIHKQLVTALKKIGVEEIKALGEEFDPTLHQAVMSVEDENAGENEVVEVFQKGYRNGDRVIRHSMVKVAN
ncbi:MAG: nucleotide exchange factor GrpE [Clostridiaceae bacterium]|jgi:molecular chaperone GrpE|nr:nucleotide exchange factor GrpE [Clostridiaceae bacterium]